MELSFFTNFVLCTRIKSQTTNTDKRNVERNKCLKSSRKIYSRLNCKKQVKSLYYYFIIRYARYRSIPEFMRLIRYSWNSSTYRIDLSLNGFFLSHVSYDSIPTLSIHSRATILCFISLDVFILFAEWRGTPMMNVQHRKRQRYETKNHCRLSSGILLPKCSKWSCHSHKLNPRFSINKSTAAASPKRFQKIHLFLHPRRFLRSFYPVLIPELPIVSPSSISRILHSKTDNPDFPKKQESEKWSKKNRCENYFSDRKSNYLHKISGLSD